MNIDKVSFNITNGTYSAKKNNKNVSFRSNIPQAVIEKEINNLNTPILKGINKLRNNIGEFQDICINAFGTGLLAPVFIKYNPLSKTDEDTRTYSAWRQPLSAVLAVLTQGLVTIPVVQIINTMSNNGWFNESCNMTPFKDDKYITKMMKKLHPGRNKTQINKMVETYKNQEAEKLYNSLRQDNTVYFNYHKGNRTEAMNPQKYTELLNKTVDAMISDEQTELDRCQKVKLQKRIDRSEFFRNNSEISEKLLAEMKENITKAKNTSEINSFMKNKYKKLKSEKANQQLLDIVEETHTRIFAGPDEMLAKINKMQEHINKYKKCTSKEQVIKYVQDSLAQRIGEHNDAIKFLKEVKNAIKEEKSVNFIEKMFKNKTKELRNEGKEFRLEDKIFAEEVAKKLKELTKKHIEGVKRISTLIFALAMLPVSCSLLNWLYPRFMDAVFPNLSSKKHSNEAKDLVEKATKNSEVK